MTKQSNLDSYLDSDIEIGFAKLRHVIDRLYAISPDYARRMLAGIVEFGVGACEFALDGGLTGQPVDTRNQP
jgi:hypothetical protein